MDGNPCGSVRVRRIFCRGIGGNLWEVSPRGGGVIVGTNNSE